jgi:hypothetical protein
MPPGRLSRTTVSRGPLDVHLGPNLSAAGNCRRSRANYCSFEPLREFGRVDNDSGMRAAPDLLVTFGCLDGELDLAPVDFRRLGLPDDHASNWRRGRWRTLTVVPTAVSPESR